MIHPIVVNPILNPVVRVTDPVRWRAGRLAPDGAILHFDASAGFVDQTGNQQAVLIGDAYPTVTAGYAINASGKEWGFSTTTGPVKAALESGEVTLVQVVTLPLMSTLDDATDYRLFGDLLFVRRDGTTGSFKVSDGTNTATVAYDWDEGEVVRVVVQCDGVMTISVGTHLFGVSAFSAASVDNKVKYSQDFSNAVWSKTASGTGVVPTLTPNYGIAPDGTQTAARLQLDIGTGTEQTDYSRLRNGTGFNSAMQRGVASLWVKTNDGSEKIVTIQDAGSYQAGQVLVTGDWQRVSDICTSGNTSRGIRIQLAGGTYGSSQTADLLIWQPSLMEMGATAAFPWPEYLPTAADYVTASRYIRNTYDVACWGDSLTAGPTLGSNIWPFTRPLSFLNNGRPWVYNGGVSSETSTQIKTRMLALAGTALFADAVTVIWAGRNNYASPDTVKADVEAMVAAVASGKFVVISILNNVTTEPVGSGAYDTIQGINSYFASLWPNNFIDITTATFADAGTRNDGLHLTYSSQQSFAKLLDAFIKSKGWVIAKHGVPCDGILPTSAQPCKGHALPIGTGKITIFDGIASASQIEEAK